MNDAMPFGAAHDAFDARGRPLLDIGVVRDAGNRIASLQWHFGHPVVTGGVLSTTAHPTPWRGYGYDVMARFSKSWEHPGTGSSIDPSGLSNHWVTESDVAALGASAARWDISREVTVGGAVSVTNAATGASRWSLPTPRSSSSHLLDTLVSPSGSRTFSHDGEGRVTSDGRLNFNFDPRGFLAYSSDSAGVVEGYLYDAEGRLSATVNGAGVESLLLHDRAQMVLATDAGGGRKWEATWGPGIDRLVSWIDASGKEHIPLVDHRNSVVGYWDVANFRLPATGEYSPDGRLIVRSDNDVELCNEQDGPGLCAIGPPENPFQFSSAWRSNQTGLVYLRNRWYSPEYAQFLSPDPLEFVDSYNPYAYVAFDPINKFDPFGLNSLGSAPGKASSDDSQTGEDRMSQNGPCLSMEVGSCLPAIDPGAGGGFETNWPVPGEIAESVEQSETYRNVESIRRRTDSWIWKTTPFNPHSTWDTITTLVDFFKVGSSGAKATVLCGTWECHAKAWAQESGRVGTYIGTVLGPKLPPRQGITSGGSRGVSTGGAGQGANAAKGGVDRPEVRSVQPGQHQGQLPERRYG